jgi:hypothetical protein
VVECRGVSVLYGGVVWRAVLVEQCTDQSSSLVYWLGTVWCDTVLSRIGPAKFGAVQICTGVVQTCMVPVKVLLC